jgi:hypothetical protein
MSEHGKQFCTGRRAPGLATVLGIALGVSACVPPEEGEVEALSSALNVAQTMNVGHTDRVLTRDQQCTYYTCKRRTGLTCVEWNPCQYQTWGAQLYADSASQAAGTPFPAYRYPGEAWVYRGCGAMAAQNVMSFFGIEMPYELGAGAMVTINWPFSDQIATRPDDLRFSLENQLNWYGVGSFKVTRTKGNDDELANALLRTKSPVIALALHGDHYLTVTGFKSTGYAHSYDINYDLVTSHFGVIDYPPNVGKNQAQTPKRASDMQRDFAGAAAWASAIPVFNGGYEEYTFLTIERSGDFLLSGQSLFANRSIVSPDGRFKLLQQTDGNLVLYRSDGLVLWAINRYGGTRAYMQNDGNLVVYDNNWNAVWASNTNGYWGSYLRVQNDGNLVIYTPGGAAVWSTGTWGY